MLYFVIIEGDIMEDRNIKISEYLRNYIKNTRKSNKLRGDNLSEQIGKGKAYLSQLENGRIKTIRERMLLTVLTAVNGDDITNINYKDAENEYIDVIAHNDYFNSHRISNDAEKKFGEIIEEVKLEAYSAYKSATKKEQELILSGLDHFQSLISCNPYALFSLLSNVAFPTANTENGFKSYSQEVNDMIDEAIDNINSICSELLVDAASFEIDSSFDDIKRYIIEDIETLSASNLRDLVNIALNLSALFGEFKQYFFEKISTNKTVDVIYINRVNEIISIINTINEKISYNKKLETIPEKIEPNDLEQAIRIISRNIQYLLHTGLYI